MTVVETASADLVLASAWAALRSSSPWPVRARAGAAGLGGEGGADGVPFVRLRRGDGDDPGAGGQGCCPGGGVRFRDEGEGEDGVRVAVGHGGGGGQDGGGNVRRRIAGTGMSTAGTEGARNSAVVAGATSVPLVASATLLRVAADWAAVQTFWTAGR